MVLTVSYELQSYELRDGKEPTARLLRRSACGETVAQKSAARKKEQWRVEWLTRASLSYMVLTVSYELQSYELRVGFKRVPHGHSNCAFHEPFGTFYFR
jgi:hypothetical protein